MDEAQWLTSVDPDPMIAFLRGASARKFRLFACACCRRTLELFAWNRRVDVAEALAVVEAFADGLVGGTDLAAVPVRLAAGSAAHAAAAQADVAALTASYFCAAFRGQADGDPDHPKGLGDYEAARSGERADQCRILRDAFGNPFRPAVMAAGWRSPTAAAVARRMYDGRVFDAMPVLADALQDAGCESPDILGHCRMPGEHFRGCWVVDRVLGKS